MKHRKHRIAWSAAWGLVAILACALWVRSYWWVDVVQTPNTLYTGVGSSHGTLRAIWRTGVVPGAVPRWSKLSVPADESEYAQSQTRGFEYLQSNTGFVVQVPCWFTLLAIGGIAALPWLRYRFSLRTLLIATTLVAAVLGLVVILR